MSISFRSSRPSQWTQIRLTISGTIQLPVINPAAHEGLVQQVGPGAAAERKALRDFLEKQFPGNGRLTWVGVGLLLAGITVGYVANMLAIAG